MAFIGMRHVVAAKVATEVEGSALTYSAGMVVGKAIQGNLTWNHNDNPLYADDAIAENDTSITGGEIELNTDDIEDAVRAYLLGDVATTTGTGTTSEMTTYETTEDSAPYVGFGYIRVRRKGGNTTYQAVWYHKAQFAENSENSQTKGETIEWQTPTLNGRIFGVRNGSDLKVNYRTRVSYDTLAAAVSWLDAKAGVTSTQTST